MLISLVDHSDYTVIPDERFFTFKYVTSPAFMDILNIPGGSSHRSSANRSSEISRSGESDRYYILSLFALTRTIFLPTVIEDISIFATVPEGPDVFFLASIYAHHHIFILTKGSLILRSLIPCRTLRIFAGRVQGTVHRKLGV